MLRRTGRFATAGATPARRTSVGGDREIALGAHPDTILDRRRFNGRVTGQVRDDNLRRTHNDEVRCQRSVEVVGHADFEVGKLDAIDDAV